MSKKKSDKNLDSMFDLVKKATELKKETSKTDIRLVTLKLMEETGELAAEVLKYVGHKVTKESKKETIKKIKAEGVDSLIVLLDILNIIGIKKEEIIRLSELALKKWQRKHLKKIKQ